MKITLLSPSHIARLAVLATVLSTSTTHGALSYNSGDVFIGFRKPGVNDTLVANLGSVTQFLPPSLGGTWNGNAFAVSFGLVPNTTNPATSLNADLVANFGLNWATNSTTGTSVRWGVVGISDNSLDDSPIVGYNARTAFVTKPRIDPNTPSSQLSSVSNNNFGSAFISFAAGIGQGSYIGLTNTANSTVAAIGDGSLANNWNTKIGTNGAFSLGSGRVVEQLNSGLNQGPTDSVLDLWVAPFAGSTLATTRTFSGGSFTLGNDGVLTFGVPLAPIPEPGTLAFGVVLIGALGLRRQRASSVA